MANGDSSKTPTSVTHAPGPNAATTPPVYTSPSLKLQHMLKTVKKDLDGNAVEDRLLGVILSVRPMDSTAFDRIHSETWLHKTINQEVQGVKAGQTSRSGITYYECHVWVEEFSSILPDIDINKLQDFTSALTKAASETSANTPKPERDKAAEKKSTDQKNIDAARLEAAKISMHPVAFFASANTEPRFNDVVKISVQKNSVTKFIARIDKIYSQAASKPKSG